MSKHTTGPWRYEAYSEGSKFMKIYCHNSKYEGDNLRGYCGEANARLIAAAPDLLEALQAIVKSLADQDEEGLIEHSKQMIAARAAIAKAKVEV